MPNGSNGLAAAGIAGGLGILGSVFQSIGAGARQRQQNAFQERLLDKQNSMNVANWKMQNAYNSDTSQVSRRRAAGLNPAGVDGSSNAGSLSGAAAPGVSAPAPVPDFGSAVSRALQARQLESAVAVNDSIVNKNNAEADAVRGNTPGSQADIALKDSQATLNAATKALTESKTVSEGLSQRLLDVERKLRNLDYERASSSTTVNGVSIASYLLPVIIEGAKAEIALNEAASSSYSRRSVRARMIVDENEAANWSDKFRSTIAAIASEIRRNNAGSTAQEFENALNSEMREWIKFNRYSKPVVDQVGSIVNSVTGVKNSFAPAVRKFSKE